MGETCPICLRPLDPLDGKCGSDDAECLRIGYDNAVKCGLKLSVEVSEQKARADAAEADLRFARLAEKERAKVQESFEAALAAARRECEGLRTLLRDHVHFLRGLRDEIDGEICPDGAHTEWCSDLTRAIERIDAALAAPAAGPSDSVTDAIFNALVSSK